MGGNKNRERGDEKERNSSKKIVGWEVKRLERKRATQGRMVDDRAPGKGGSGKWGRDRRTAADGQNRKAQEAAQGRVPGEGVSIQDRVEETRQT